MTFPADLLAAERLSPAARRFLERVEAEPALLRRETFAPLLASCREVIPTRVERRTVDHHGAERPLPELLAAERGSFVLKQAIAVGGQGVVVGRSEDPAAWTAAVERALAGGDWIAQEYVDTPLYPFQAGEEGWAPHRLVWGPFVFGDDYGGLFVRLLPTDCGPVVNTGRSAVLGLAFEVPGA